MTGQWTVTGAGAVVLEKGVYGGPRVTCATIGKIIDLGQKDVNDMGSAMAPAAADTIKQHLDDTNRPSDYYDLIVTGDLGKVGSALIKQLFVKHGIVPEPNYSDCGVLIFNETQDVHAGEAAVGVLRLCCADPC